MWKPLLSFCVQVASLPMWIGSLPQCFGGVKPALSIALMDDTQWSISDSNPNGLRFTPYLVMSITAWITLRVLFDFWKKTEILIKNLPVRKICSEIIFVSYQVAEQQYCQSKAHLQNFNSFPSNLWGSIALKATLSTSNNYFKIEFLLLKDLILSPCRDFWFWAILKDVLGHSAARNWRRDKRSTSPRSGGRARPYGSTLIEIWKFMKFRKMHRKCELSGSSLAHGRGLLCRKGFEH